jgi:uncharacterized protein (TIGR00290 family)
MRAVAFWSGGKDSGLALDRVRRNGSYDVVALITTVNGPFRRVSMHGVREELIDKQAQAVGIPVHKMYVGGGGSNDDYVRAMCTALELFKSQGVAHVIFGDIFLEDLRQWREGLLGSLGMTGVFPLWKANTRALASEFIERHFKAIVCCTDDAHLNETFVGRPLDQAMFQSLPATVDPCGENGEYHTFMYDGPIFHEAVKFEVGQIVYRPLQAAALTGTSSAAPPQSSAAPVIPVPAMGSPTATKGFWFVDLLPADGGSATGTIG